ncbi:uncharacterized protein LOC113345318 isoform X2 [Papaver somniferum]|uniref:uncharacterized protein LOC113345318 isoform X2 n=1 Tax=Papaver somniferum TaxID=3469 RepID=UPI000E6F66A5|nr:uncharacterized protein LOC113345318 isoform X2 [Papaver somniferum]
MVDPITPRRKLKWTLPEEAALKSGVNKHGAGKWKNIVSDPEFGPFLVSRTNVDLKDKWRNMTGESSYRPKVKLVPTTTFSKSPKSAICNPADVYTEVKWRGNRADCVPAVVEIIDCFENSRKQDACDESTVSDTGASEGSVEISSSNRSRDEISGMMDNSCNGSLGASAKRNGSLYPIEVLVAAIELIDSHELVRVSEVPTEDILVPDNPKENKLAVPNFLRKRFREKPPQNYAIQKKAVKKFKSSSMVDSSNFDTLMMAVNYVSKNDNDEPEEKETHSLLDNAEKQSEAVLVNKSVAVSSGIHQVLGDMSANSAEDRSLRIRKLASFELSILPEGNTLVSDRLLGIKKLTSFKLGSLQEGNTSIRKSSKVCSSYNKGFSCRNNDQQRAYMSAEKSCREQCLLMANSHGGNMRGCENRQTSNMTSEQQRLQKNFCWRERRKRLDTEAEAYILKDRRRQHSFLLQHPSTNSQKLQAPPAIMGQHVKSECQVLGHDTSVKISSNGFPSYNEKGFAQTVCDRSASQKATQQRRRASIYAKKSVKKLEEHQCLLKRLRRRFLEQNDVGMGQMHRQTTSKLQVICTDHIILSAFILHGNEEKRRMEKWFPFSYVRGGTRIFL